MTRRLARRARWMVVLPVVGGAVLLAGCGGDKGQNGTQPPGATATASEVDGVQTVETDAGDNLRFTNTDLVAKPGEVRIVLKVTGDVPHNLAFSDGNQASTGTISNKTATLDLKFANPGTYHFLCTIHPYMKGTLTIS